MRLHLFSRWFSMPLVLIVSFLAININVAPQPAAAAPGTTPILLILNSTDDATKPYDAYLGEILRAEGWNSYDTQDLSTITSVSSLSGYKLVILADTALNAAQATLFTSFVSGGGRLLAMRPDTQLAPVFALTLVGTQNDGYLNINTSVTTGAGLPGSANAAASGAKPLQIHGVSDRYTTTTATKVALLFSNATTATANPAVVLNTYGTGKAAAFTYDLASNIVLTRQGNPTNGSTTHPTSGVMGDTDGDGVPRTIDLFQNRLIPSQPWVDLNNVPTPQADEQMRLMSHLIEDLSSDLTPLPHLWYFPQNTPGTDAAMTMLIPTGDAHGQAASQFQKEINSVTSYQGKMTFYLSLAGDPDAASVETWEGQGYSFGIHPYWYQPDPNYEPYDITSFPRGYDVYSGIDGNGGWYGGRFTNPKSRTVRNHQVAWLGWTDAAEVEVAHGIGLDANFYAWGPWLKKSNGTWAHGYVNGSGQPMKFAKNDGTVINLYQQGTQLVDEQLLAVISSVACPSSQQTEGFECLTGTQAYNNVSKPMIDASLAGNYAALMTQFHVDYYDFGEPQTWAEQTMNYARSNNIPIWNADQWLNFTETRHDASFTNTVWNASTSQLSFNMSSVGDAANKLSVMVPATSLTGNFVSVAVDGVDVTSSTSTKPIKGRSYKFFLVTPGAHSVVVTYQNLLKAATISPTSPMTTPEDQTKTGLLVNVGSGDTFTTHFKITNITGGTLYKSDGTTVINNNDFITKAEGTAGLKFTPTKDLSGVGGFTAQAAVNPSNPSFGPSPANATINVTSVNDVPEFTLPSTPVTVNEDAGAQSAALATNVRPGPATATDETAQTLTFNVAANSNPALFSVAPSVDAAGNLTFTPAPNANGSANVTLTLKDNGGTSNGGVDTSAPQTVTIVVNPVNDAPLFTLPSSTATINEDAGAQSLTAFATSISAGPASATDESGQSLTFSVVVQGVSGNLAFTSAPAIDAATGALTFAIAADTNGTATVLVSLSDNGGTANGGVDTSAPQTVTIVVNPVNDAPSFTAGPNETVRYNAGAQTFAAWAINLRPGPAAATDEAGQAFSFNASVQSTTGDLAFSSVPAIDAAGTLTFAAANGTSGTATIQVSLSDNGGTTNGGVDTSASQTLVVTVNPPGTLSGVAFYDRNNDGVFDGGDLGLGGALITLKDSTGATTLQSATTKPDGTYSILNVSPGNYLLVNTPSSGYGNGTPASVAITVPVEGLANQNFTLTTGSIRGSVYVDANHNGTRDADEIGIAGVQITLTGTDASGASASKQVITAADGGYLFDELLAGTYMLTEAQPTSHKDGKVSIGTAGGTVTNKVVSGITLGGGVNATGYLFGELVLDDLDTSSFVYLPLTISAARP